MADNFADALNNMKKMIDSGNIPPDVQGMINNLANSNVSQNDLSNMLNQVSPEMLANIASSFNSNNSNNANSTNNFSNNQNNNSNSNFNIDMNTMLKMKKVVESMNQKNDPRANLLYSLKPYLRDAKKDKLDQYVNLLNMTKVAEIMKNDKKENNPDA